MAWNQGYQSSGAYHYQGYRGQGGFQNRGNNFGGGGYRQGGYQNKPQKKHSGATFGYAHGDASKPYVRGWKWDRTHATRSFIAGPNKKTKRVKSKSGREWENWTAKVTGREGPKLYNALYDCQKKRVYINDLGIVMSPSGGSGGYTGPFFRRKGK